MIIGKGADKNVGKIQIIKNLDKNFKLMAMSAVVLLILFIYTIYKKAILIFKVILII